MTNKDENINNEKEDSITLETEAIEQAEATDTETNSATETMENEDCGKLPQNQKDDKKNKWLLLAIGIATVIIVGILTTKFLSKDNKPEESIDYMQYVQGIQDLEITSFKDKYDYLSGITFDKEHINEVTVDDTQVDLTKSGEYQLTYLIDVKDEKVEDLKQVVTVKVVTAKKEDDKKPKDTENKDKPSSSQNQSSDSKPSNTGNSSNNTGTNSQPSNSGSSNNSSSTNTDNKPTSPTHTHSWQPVTKTVHHEAQGHYETITISEAWDEPIYEDYELCICNQCGADITGNTTAHFKNSLLNGGNCGGWHSEYRQDLVDTIHHPAKTEKQWVVDENGWTETVTIYKCSCGATK